MNPSQPTPPEQGTPADSGGATDPSFSVYPRRRSRKRLLIVASLVVLAVGGVFLWNYLSGFESTDDAQVPAVLLQWTSLPVPGS
jgi:membrane fusion protein (multidrug efflux system)